MDVTSEMFKSNPIKQCIFLKKDKSKKKQADMNLAVVYQFISLSQGEVLQCMKILKYV